MNLYQSERRSSTSYRRYLRVQHSQRSRELKQIHPSSRRLIYQFHFHRNHSSCCFLLHISVFLFHCCYCCFGLVPQADVAFFSSSTGDVMMTSGFKIQMTISLFLSICESTALDFFLFYAISRNLFFFFPQRFV